MDAILSKLPATDSKMLADALKFIPQKYREECLSTAWLELNRTRDQIAERGKQKVSSLIQAASRLQIAKDRWGAMPGRSATNKPGRQSLDLALRDNLRTSRQIAVEGARAAIRDTLIDLCPFDRLIVRLLSEGFDRCEVADMLEIASTTVYDHMNEIYRVFRGLPDTKPKNLKRMSVLAGEKRPEPSPVTLRWRRRMARLASGMPARKPGRPKGVKDSKPRAPARIAA